MFKNFGNKIQEMKEKDYDVARSRGALALQQTQRNLSKSELMEALYHSLVEVGDEYGFEVYNTADGVILEVENENVMKKVNRLKDKSEQDIFGYISIEFNLKIKNLDYDAQLEEELYVAEIAARAAEKAKKEASKKRKIQDDAEARAVKQRLREAKIARLLEDRKE